MLTEMCGAQKKLHSVCCKRWHASRTKLMLLRPHTAATCTARPNIRHVHPPVVNLQVPQTGHGAPLLGQRPAQAVVLQVPAGRQGAHIRMTAGRLVQHGPTWCPDHTRPALLRQLCTYIGGYSPLPGLQTVVPTHEHMHACAYIVLCVACRVHVSH
jgi:hypothetical protein